MAQLIAVRIRGRTEIQPQHGARGHVDIDRAGERVLGSGPQNGFWAEGAAM